MLAPAGSLFTTSVAINCVKWICALARLPAVILMVRESLEYPDLLVVIECWPGCRFVRVNGVTQLGSVAPSIWTCAPSGLDSMANWPGIITGAAGLFLFLEFRVFAGAAADSSTVTSGC